MKKLLLALMLISSVANAEEYRKCSSGKKYAGGKITYNTIQEEYGYPAEFDEGAERWTNIGYVLIIEDKVHFYQPKKLFGSQIILNIPIEAFYCLTRYR